MFGTARTRKEYREVAARGWRKKGQEGSLAPHAFHTLPICPVADTENQSRRMGDSRYTAGKTETQRGTHICSGWFRVELELETTGPR